MKYIHFVKNLDHWKFSAGI